MAVYYTTIKDYKLKIPDDLKECFTEHKYVLTRGKINNTIYLYKVVDWEEFEIKLNSLPKKNEKLRTFRRFFLTSAVDVERDGNYIVLSEGLCRRVYELKDVETANVMMYFDDEYCDKWVVERED